jgi:hypothetical protein
MEHGLVFGLDGGSVRENENWGKKYVSMLEAMWNVRNDEPSAMNSR